MSSFLVANDHVLCPISPILLRGGIRLVRGVFVHFRVRHSATILHPDNLLGIYHNRLDVCNSSFPNPEIYSHAKCLLW